jgi:hypothetical protein
MSGVVVHRIRRMDGIAGQVCYEATVSHAGERPELVAFAGSIYGGPVVMISPQNVQTFVAEPDRFGTFNENWVRRFFA